MVRTPQVLKHRTEWDPRAGVGIHRRDCELAALFTRGN